jgi:hypothetical protein
MVFSRPAIALLMISALAATPAHAQTNPFAVKRAADAQAYASKVSAYRAQADAESNTLNKELISQRSETDNDMASYGNNLISAKQQHDSDSASEKQTEEGEEDRFRH